MTILIREFFLLVIFEKNKLTGIEPIGFIIFIIIIFQVKSKSYLKNKKIDLLNSELNDYFISLSEYMNYCRVFIILTGLFIFLKLQILDFFEQYQKINELCENVYVFANNIWFKE